jgi:Ca2+/H+ antiporter
MTYSKVLYISGKGALMGDDGVLLTAAVNVMTYVVGDGKSNWLEGAILICLSSSFLCLWFLNSF